MYGWPTIAVVLPVLVPSISAQMVNTVWNSVVFTYRGEQEPVLYYSPSPALSSLGANQAYNAGAYLRSRYLVPNSGQNATYVGIRNIESSYPNADQLSVLSPDDEATANSAQAFLQGLYPPSNALQSTSLTTMADGTQLQYPLNGYQYIPVETASQLDWNHIWIAGSEQCINYQLSTNSYATTREFSALEASTNAFYSSLATSVFQPTGLSLPSFTYSSAYVLWEYANYQYNHNATAHSLIPQSQLSTLYTLASTKAFAWNGNLTASGARNGDMIRAISGRTLAYKVVQYLATTIASNGRASKLNLMFGSYQPFMAFFALSGLASRSPVPFNSLAFQSLPLPGSTMVFELFSSTPATYNLTNGIPSEDYLWVRFMFRNGTDAAAQLVSYPLFGRGNSESDMTWSDFKTLMAGISIKGFSDWCQTCGGATTALFCPLFMANEGTTSGTTSPVSTIPITMNSPASSSTFSPTLAGAIGAIVMFALMCCIAVLVALFSGLRLSKKPQGKRTWNSWGGFKGDRKMQSDLDVSIAKAEPIARAVQVGVGPDSDDITNPGVVKKERLGSWEMKTPTSPPPAWTQWDSRTSDAGHQWRPEGSREEEDTFDFSCKPVTAFERV